MATRTLFCSHANPGASILKRALSAGSIALAFAGCTVVTDARDYKVDPEVSARSLDFTFENMTHPSQALDVAVVDSDGMMQARARIILAPDDGGKPPTEHLQMSNALTPGDQKLYFYVDGNDNFAIDKGEHIWIKPVPPNGVGSFVHSTVFQHFTAKDFQTLNADLVLDYPLGDAERACVAKQVGKLETLEAKVFLTAEDRQVGLFKTYGANGVPSSIRLNGILDAGSEYRVEIWAEDDIKKTFTVTASPDTSKTELHVPAAKWVFVNTSSALCR